MDLRAHPSFQMPPAAIFDCCPSRCVETFVETLYRAFTSGVADGPPSIGQVADALGMSVRSLQRHLKQRGFSYTRLVDEVRMAVAVDRLVEPSTKMIEIAFDLGYSDPAHFTRAFRRWVGVSPREFRSHRLAS